MPGREPEHRGNPPNNQNDADDNAWRRAADEPEHNQDASDQDPQRWMGLNAGHSQHTEYL
jgi:hypothetical protein